ncbi:MAG TPA: hypothetical protein VJO53_07570 [Candidatus Acidoferrales bacterium]|nr:hypothetical protein [Candidatus Acidoferrales bacterium]
MRRLNQKFCLALIVLTSAFLVGAKTVPKAVAERTPLLEVVRMSWTVERDETLLYLRVYSDGFAEADPMKQVDFRHLKLKERWLSSDELAWLTSLLADPETAKLLPEYSSSWGNKDFGYKYEITISVPSRKQLQLVDFQPFLARKKGKPYPKQLEKLGCSVWKLRAEVSGEPLEKDWLKGCAELGY